MFNVKNQLPPPGISAANASSFLSFIRNEISEVSKQDTSALPEKIFAESSLNSDKNMRPTADFLINYITALNNNGYTSDTIISMLLQYLNTHVLPIDASQHAIQNSPFSTAPPPAPYKPTLLESYYFDTSEEEGDAIKASARPISSQGTQNTTSSIQNFENTPLTPIETLCPSHTVFPDNTFDNTAAHTPLLEKNYIALHAPSPIQLSAIPCIPKNKVTNTTMHIATLPFIAPKKSTDTLYKPIRPKETTSTNTFKNKIQIIINEALGRKDFLKKSSHLKKDHAYISYIHANTNKHKDKVKLYSIEFQELVVDTYKKISDKNKTYRPREDKFIPLNFIGDLFDMGERQLKKIIRSYTFSDGSKISVPRTKKIAMHRKIA